MKSVKTKSATAFILGAAMFTMLSFTTESVTARNTDSKSSTIRHSAAGYMMPGEAAVCPMLLGIGRCPGSIFGGGAKPNVSADEYPAEAFD